MGRYSVTNQLGGTPQAIAATFKTILSMFATSGSLRRGRLVEVIVAADGSPANNALVVQVARMTADGTGTTITPLPLDPADPAALCTAKANYTAEPTVTANSGVLEFALNQQATVRWVPDPDTRLMFPATANNGLVIRVKSASYTGTVTVTAIFEE